MSRRDAELLADALDDYAALARWHLLAGGEDEGAVDRDLPPIVARVRALWELMRLEGGVAALAVLYVRRFFARLPEKLLNWNNVALFAAVAACVACKYACDKSIWTGDWASLAGVVDMRAAERQFVNALDWDLSDLEIPEERWRETPGDEA